jgi:transcriptional regulator with XRE-family HTH domain
MAIAEALAENLKARRKQLRLSQDQVAERARERTGATVYHSDVSRWESGARRPTIEKIEALAAALSCTVADLMTPGWEPQLPEGF